MNPKQRQVKVKSLKNQAVIADKCHVADSFFDRLIGLIGRRSFGAGEGMLFPRCNDIHMWFMSIPIDVVFLEPAREGASGERVFRVSSLRRAIRPWKPLPVRDGRASETLELPSGTVERCGIAMGDELCIS
jgi:uncharacterized membrane protein (UPF0127 family)